MARVEGARTADKCARQAAGFLCPIADKALAELTVTDTRAAYETAARKSPQRVVHAMQVLRWHGVVMADNPLGREAAGRDRITIFAAQGDSSLIALGLARHVA
jgi:hypothetical protein